VADVYDQVKAYEVAFSYRDVPDALELVGIAVHGARNAVDKVMKGNRMHP
jgi:hypothetical protein